MNYHFYLTFNHNSYDVHMRDGTIVSILCNNEEILYDDLSLPAREAILLEALLMFEKIKSNREWLDERR